MILGLSVLAVSPQSFLWRFRSEKSLLIYDPSFGAANGRLVSEEIAVQAISEYERLFARMQRLIDVSLKAFICAIIVQLCVMFAVKPSILMLTLELSIAAIIGVIAAANFRLWKFRSDVWKSIEHGIAADRMSSDDRISQGYRLSWRDRFRVAGFLILVGPIYIFGHLGGDPKLITFLGIDVGKGQVYYKIFMLLAMFGFLVFVIRQYIKERKQKLP